MQVLPRNKFICFRECIAKSVNWTFMIHAQPRRNLDAIQYTDIHVTDVTHENISAKINSKN